MVVRPNLIIFENFFPVNTNIDDMRLFVTFVCTVKRRLTELDFLRFLLCRMCGIFEVLTMKDLD